MRNSFMDSIAQSSTVQLGSSFADQSGESWNALFGLCREVVGRNKDY